MARTIALALLVSTMALGACATGSEGTSLSNEPQTTLDAACPEETTRLYVVSNVADLYSFDTDSRSFTKRGHFDCPDMEATVANSMAIDRDGFAWLNFSDGTLFKASLTTAHCERTSFRPAQAGFFSFGMAFVHEPASRRESLFVSSLGTGRGLGKIDTASLTLEPVGDYTGDLSGANAELSSSSDGALYALFRSNPPALAELAPDTGAIVRAEGIRDLDAGYAFAFSHDRGDFVFYTAGEVGNSKVTRYRPKTHASDVLVTDAGFRVVGAGVSTCAK